MNAVRNLHVNADGKFAAEFWTIPTDGTAPYMGGEATFPSRADFETMLANVKGLGWMIEPHECRACGDLCPQHPDVDTCRFCIDRHFGKEGVVEYDELLAAHDDVAAALDAFDATLDQQTHDAWHAYVAANLGSGDPVATSARYVTLRAVERGAGAVA